MSEWKLTPVKDRYWQAWAVFDEKDELVGETVSNLKKHAVADRDALREAGAIKKGTVSRIRIYRIEEEEEDV